MKQNLVFIMTDQQRADTLGMKSGNTEVTPALNQLAGESTVFERAYNTCPLCVPARTALATGMNPIKNGMIFPENMQEIMKPYIRCFIRLVTK